MFDFTQIKFNSTYHTYTLGGRRLQNVTRLVSEVKRPFDREGISKKKAAELGVPQEFILAEWDAKRDAAIERGKETHAHIEWVLKGGNYLDPVLSLNDYSAEVLAFNGFWTRASEQMEVYQVEWVVGDGELGIAGTIDTVFYSHKTQQYHLFDWKTGTIERSSPWGKMLSPFGGYDDCNLNHYSLQLSIYRLILEKNTGLALGNSYIVNLAEGGWHIDPAVDLREIAGGWLKEKVAQVEN